MGVDNAKRVTEMVVLAAYISTFGLAAVSGLAIDLAGIAPILACAAAFLLIAALCTRFDMPRVREGTICVAYGFLLTTPIALATYLAIRLDLPLQDHNLAALDAAIGFDWHYVIDVVDGHPALVIILNAAYGTFALQLLLWPLLLAIAGHAKRAHVMVASFAVICFLSSLISVWTPAVGTYSYYGFDGSLLKKLNPLYGYDFLDQFNAVREDANFVWSVEASKGILTFPSVHAAVAFLCAWAAWPLAPVRYPVIALNIAMACSAVTSGSHYAVDVVAGCAVAMVSIAFIVWASRLGRTPAAVKSAPLPQGATPLDGPQALYPRIAVEG
ncbi:phosphatase PAP2 family protein [Rhizobium sp. 16-449-1b]|uniref:phosphatase PAP2 family protein n=1 Tax=Rhizobium sp. 16-449-1b TaxID=2819989 RepID=UPI001AD9C765|nr:phosphatase PAP2 family protein [Rhizobium sp. 16-449-1b]MBO9193501.1 phosphatase PAP2 family protein [Rhizobium sp. 16-449-1b]